MPFIERSGNGEWIRKECVRLVQQGPNAKKTYFTFDETVAYTAERRQSTTPEQGFAADRVEEIINVPIRPAGGASLVDPTDTDLASIPEFLWGIVPSYGRHTLVALMHDVLCVRAQRYRELPPRDPGTARLLRRSADLLFRVSAADAAQMPWAKRWMMWTAIRLFGSRIVAASTMAVALALPYYLLAVLGGPETWLTSSPSVWSAPMIAVALIFWPFIILWVLAVRVVFPLFELVFHLGDPIVEWPYWSLLPYLPILPAIALVVAVLCVARESTKSAYPLEPGFVLPRRYASSLASVVGAVLLGLVLAPLLLPVIVITGVTRLLIAFVDLVSKVPRKDHTHRFSIFPFEHQPAGAALPSPGDQAGTPPLDGGTVVLVDRYGIITNLPQQRWKIDVGSDWEVGVLVNRAAEDATKIEISQWIAEKFAGPSADHPS